MQRDRAEPDAAELARNRGHGEVRVGRLEELPWDDGTFDLITCLDVIEHTPDDITALRELRRVTRPGGFLLVTVPAYQALWSLHDEANHHYRRYSRGARCAAALGPPGWKVERVSSFNSLLLAPAAAVRLAQRRMGPRNGYTNDLALGPAWLNDVLERPLALEARWLARGRTLPAGLSLLAVLRSRRRGDAVKARGPRGRCAARGAGRGVSARPRRHHQRLQQPGLSAARDHRPGVDGRAVAGGDGARPGGRAGQPGQAPDLARDPDRGVVGDRRRQPRLPARPALRPRGAGGPGPFHKQRLELIATGDRFFERHGPKAVFFARWIALVRFAAAWLAGINQMPLRQFFFWNALGGISWGVTFGLVGYFGGSAAADAISSFGLYAFGALLLLFVVYI